MPWPLPSVEKHRKVEARLGGYAGHRVYLGNGVYIGFRVEALGLEKCIS